jgi:multidrug efflux pump subunit AcrA (membrane-fusion protein)
MSMSSVAAPPGSDVVSPRPGPDGRGRSDWLSRKRLLLGAALVLVLVAVGGGAAWVAGRSPSSAAAGAPVVTTSSENVKVGTATMTQTVSASGTLEPAHDSDLGFAVSGTVSAVNVAVGQKVKRGQTLATIDRTALADQVAAAKSTLASDEDQLTSDEDDDALSSTIDSVKSQVTSAESQLATARADLADAALKATFSGTVAAVDFAVADTVSAGGGSTGSGAAAASSTGSSSSGSSGITVISSDAYTISTSVDDTEVSEVKAGDAATIVPSGSTTTLTGNVASVSLIASTSSDSTVASFPVVIDVTGKPSGIYPGASATVSIIVKNLKNVVEIPTAAISYTGGRATVTKVSGGSKKTVDVKTGTSLNGETQITRGLAAGDTIVEEVTKFKTANGSTRTLFGGGSSTTGRGTGGFSRTGSFAGGPPAGGQGGAPAAGTGTGALFGGGG